MLVVKNSSANAGDTGDRSSIPGSGPSPGLGNGNPLQYSCLENLTDRGTWRDRVHAVTESQTWLSIYIYVCVCVYIYIYIYVILLLPTHSGTLNGVLVLACWKTQNFHLLSSRVTGWWRLTSLQSLVILSVQLFSKSKGYNFSKNLSIVATPATPRGCITFEAGSFQEQFLQELCSRENMTLSSFVCTATLVTLICWIAGAQPY